MAKWFYYNESGEKIEVTGGQLKGLAKAGMITPDTIVETEEGKSAPARKVKGLTFVAAQSETEQSESPQSVSDVPSSSEPSPFTVAPIYENHPAATTVPDQAKQPVSSPLTSTQLFCTNCGQPVTEQAFACMSCGAAPVGYKKFCRHCGVGLNPEQIICIKCGAGISVPAPLSKESESTISPVTSPQINSSHHPSRIEDHLVWSVISIILFLPLGIYALHYSLLCRKELAAGRYDSAVIQSTTAHNLNIYSIYAFITFWAIMIFSTLSSSMFF